MQINFNPRDLTAAERVHVAAFISDWPSAESATPLAPYVSPTATVRPEDWAPVIAALHAANSGVTVPTFQGKTETELLADEHAADMQPTDPEDDNTDKAAALAAFTPGATPDRDSEGLPWDRRIHSSSKAINADGRWRIARNVAPELIESVKAELRALVAAAVTPPPVEVVPPPPVDIVMAACTTVAEAAQQSMAALTAVAPPPVAAVDPAPTAPDLNLMFTTLLRDAGQAVVAQRVTSAELTAICVKHGVANVGLLAARKDLVPQIDAEFRALLASKVQP